MSERRRFPLAYDDAHSAEIENLGICRRRITLALGAHAQGGKIRARRREGERRSNVRAGASERRNDGVFASALEIPLRLHEGSSAGRHLDRARELNALPYFHIGARVAVHFLAMPGCAAYTRGTWKRSLYLT